MLMVCIENCAAIIPSRYVKAATFSSLFLDSHRVHNTEKDMVLVFLFKIVMLIV